MTEVPWERYPLVAACSSGRVWLQIQADLGLARNTVEAYGRALQDYLAFSERAAIAAEGAARALVQTPRPRLVLIPTALTGHGCGAECETPAVPLTYLTAHLSFGAAHVSVWAKIQFFRREAPAVTRLFLTIPGALPGTSCR